MAHTTWPMARYEPSLLQGRGRAGLDTSKKLLSSKILLQHCSPVLCMEELWPCEFLSEVVTAGWGISFVAFMNSQSFKDRKSH